MHYFLYPDFPSYNKMLAGRSLATVPEEDLFSDLDFPSVRSSQQATPTTAQAPSALGSSNSRPGSTNPLEYARQQDAYQNHISTADRSPQQAGSPNFLACSPTSFDDPQQSCLVQPSPSPPQHHHPQTLAQQFFLSQHHSSSSVEDGQQEDQVISTLPPHHSPVSQAYHTSPIILAPELVHSSPQHSDHRHHHHSHHHQQLQQVVPQQSIRLSFAHQQPIVIRPAPQPTSPVYQPCSPKPASPTSQQFQTRHQHPNQPPPSSSQFQHPSPSVSNNQHQQGAALHADQHQQGTALLADEQQYPASNKRHQAASPQFQHRQESESPQQPTSSSPQFQHRRKSSTSSQRQQQQPSSPRQQLQQQPLSISPQQHSHQPSDSGLARSQSQHDLQQQTPDGSFVIPNPKLVPRRRSHSSGGSNSSGGQTVSAPSLAPYQIISTVLPGNSLSSLSLASSQAGFQPIAPAISSTVTHLASLKPAVSISRVTPNASLPNLLPITSMPHGITTPSGVSLKSLSRITTSSSASSMAVTGPMVSMSSTHSGSALIEQLLSSGPYHPVSVGSPIGDVKSTNSIVGPSHNGKVSIIFPSMIMSQSIASTTNCTSTTSHSHINQSIIKSSLSPPVTSSNFTLSAVTPSSLKIRTSSQFSGIWNPVTSGSFDGVMKSSPPHHEPTSPLMLNAPSPPCKPFRPKNENDRVQYKEHRRVCHINAEQKRRSNLKNNFDIMHYLIPSISQNPNAKISKAAMLQKGAEYIHQIKLERQLLTEHAESLRTQIDKLSSEISNAQALLPATGAPMTHAKNNKLKEMFIAYTREKTIFTDWKFWIFSLIAEPLLESYNESVSTGNLDDMCRSSMAWLDQHCSLNFLRPLVSHAMRKLSTSTNVLSQPETLAEEVYKYVTKKEAERSERFSTPR